MKPWWERPVELANLLNPAFCGFLVRSAVTSYTEVRPEGMPFALAFLVLPLVLHMNTRDALPASISTTLIAWLEAHPEVRVDFDARVRSLTAFTREAVIFLMHRRLITFTDGAMRLGSSELVGSQAAIDRMIRGSEETAACVRRARLVGRWLAQSGDAATVYALFGVRP
jgi:hypothetical protein